MTLRLCRAPVVVALLTALWALSATPAVARAQAAKQAGTKKPKKQFSPDDSVKYKPTPLFDSSDPLTFTLTFDVGRLKKDRTGETPFRPAKLTFKASDTASYTVPIQVQTRGIWRRKNCEIPPIRMDLPKDSLKHTVMAGQNHLKLTLPCKNKDDFEQLILQEANLYRVYNLLTPASHRMRLVKLTIVDSASAKPVMARWAFVTESSPEMAARNGAHEYDVKGATGDDLEPHTTTIVGLFQYLIGNTDFSVPGLHNVELISQKAEVLPVVYDFDWTGVVNPPYGFPDSRLPIKRLTDHLFRGPCGPPSEYPAAFELFKSKRAAITALYKDDIGKLIDAGRVKETLDFFDDFYKTIGNAGDVRRNIMETCKSS